jgi:hypothetical protein
VATPEFLAQVMDQAVADTCLRFKVAALPGFANSGLSSGVAQGRVKYVDPDPEMERQRMRSGIDQAFEANRQIDRTDGAFGDVGVLHYLRG